MTEMPSSAPSFAISDLVTVGTPPGYVRVPLDELAVRIIATKPSVAAESRGGHTMRVERRRLGGLGPSYGKRELTVTLIVPEEALCPVSPRRRRSVLEHQEPALALHAGPRGVLAKGAEESLKAPSRHGRTRCPPPRAVGAARSCGPGSRPCSASMLPVASPSRAPELTERRDGRPAPTGPCEQPAARSWSTRSNSATRSPRSSQCAAADADTHGTPWLAAAGALVLVSILPKVSAGVAQGIAVALWRYGRMNDGSPCGCSRTGSRQVPGRRPGELSSHPEANR